MRRWRNPPPAPRRLPASPQTPRGGSREIQRTGGDDVRALREQRPDAGLLEAREHARLTPSVANETAKNRTECRRRNGVAPPPDWTPAWRKTERCLCGLHRARRIFSAPRTRPDQPAPCRGSRCAIAGDWDRESTFRWFPSGAGRLAAVAIAAASPPDRLRRARERIADRTTFQPARHGHSYRVYCFQGWRRVDAR